MTKLSPELIRQIEAIVERGQRAEIVMTTDRRTQRRRIVVWAVSSKQKYEQPIA